MTNPFRPGSFAYHDDIQSALAPWRSHLGEDFDIVVARLAGRDRALEDHLNIGVSQGYLAQTFYTTSPELPADMTDIPDFNVTFTVRSGRQIRVTTQVRVIALSATPVSSSIQVRNQDDDIVSWDYYIHGDVGTAAGVYQYHMTALYSPPAGTHTLRVQGQSMTGTAQMETLATAFGSSTFISVEDVGPARQL